MNEDRATRYQRLKRRVRLLALGWSVVLLIGLLVTGASRALRAHAEAVAGGRWPATLVLYVIGVSLLNEAVGLPLGFWSGYVLERRYGLSNESLAAWLRDQAKALVIGLLFACAGVLLLYGLIRWSPDWWWLTAGLLFSIVIVGLTQLAPVVLLPLFYTIKPLARETLRTRLMSLADQAGARVLDAYEWGLSEKTKKANAALAGIGGTRRILVSDTMLAEYSDDEIAVVLAHELGHHVHGDIWKGILFETGLILAGCFVAFRVLAMARAPLGLNGIADPAGLPLLLLAAGAVSLVMGPVAHALSRAHERSADAFALRLTGNPAAFVSAMRRLGAQNLAEEQPSKIVQWLFHSHPPIRERIAAARAYPSA